MKFLARKTPSRRGGTKNPNEKAPLLEGVASSEIFTIEGLLQPPRKWRRGETRPRLAGRKGVRSNPISHPAECRST